MQAYSGEIREEQTSLSNIVTNIDTLSALIGYKSLYDRRKAVAYADKYCGAAWGSGNNFKYNRKYPDYNGIGGDCTNFASQVLGDKEGGGMPFGGGWNPSSRAWCNADSLKNYLVHSGRGSIIRIGTYKSFRKASQWGCSKIETGGFCCL